MMTPTERAEAKEAYDEAAEAFLRIQTAQVAGWKLVGNSDGAFATFEPQPSKDGERHPLYGLIRLLMSHAPWDGWMLCCRYEDAPDIWRMQEMRSMPSLEQAVRLWREGHDNHGKAWQECQVDEMPEGASIWGKHGHSEEDHNEQ